MGEQALGLAEDFPGEAIEKAPVDSHELLSYSETSNLHSDSVCAIAQSEGLSSSDYSKAPNTCGNPGTPVRVIASKIAVEKEHHDTLNYEGHDSTCVSKDEALMKKSDQISEGDHTNVMSRNGASLKKSLNGQSAAAASSCAHFSSQEDNSCSLRVHECTSEAMLRSGYLSARQGPSKSLVREEGDGATVAKDMPSNYRIKQVDLPQGKMTDSSIVCQKVEEKSCASMEPETRFIDDSLKNSHGNEYSYNARAINTQKPSPQNQTMADSNGLVELVDVRVCDICGDVGREALLALCSRCSDGAEHIYCMRIKRDNIPDGDWMCEECSLMPEPKRPRPTETQKSESILSSPYWKVTNQRPQTTDCGVRHLRQRRTTPPSNLPVKRPGSNIGGKPLSKRRAVLGTKKILTPLSPLKITDKSKDVAHPEAVLEDRSAKGIVERACSPSGHRSPTTGVDLEVRSASKKRTLERTAQSQSFGSGGKILSRVSSLKILDSDNAMRDQATPFGSQSAKRVEQAHPLSVHRSQKPELQFRREPLRKSKSINNGNSCIKMPWPDESIRLEKKTAEEKGDKNLQKKHKLFKSMSFNGVRSALIDAPKVQVSDTSKIKGPKFGRERKLTGQRNPTSVSDAMDVLTSGSNAVLETVKGSCKLSGNVLDMKAIQFDQNSNVEVRCSVAVDGQKYASNLVPKSVEENTSSSQSSYGMSCPAKIVDSCPDVEQNQTMQKAEVGCSSRDDSISLVASEKGLPFNSCPTEEPPALASADGAPSGASAFPESEFVWKGAFELENGGKLSNGYHGIQAHLSTCASSKVSEVVLKFRHKLSVKEVPRLSSWPNKFLENKPTEQDIALYFFPEDLQSYQKCYKVLIEDMIKHDLALEANFDGVQLLVFPSTLLPLRSQCWNSLSFLWGVLRARKVDSCSIQIPSSNVATLTEGPGIYGTHNGCFSTENNGCITPCCAYHNSITGPKSVKPMLSRSSASTKSLNESIEHDEVSSAKECLGSWGKQNNGFSEADIISSSDRVKEEDFPGGQWAIDLQREHEFTYRGMKCLLKTHTPEDGSPNKENVLPFAVDAKEREICSERDYWAPSFSRIYDPPPMSWREEKKFDPASWSSFSIESGPSGSSDGVGCAKSDEGQVEQIRDDQTYKALDLDLRLGTGFDPEEQVDLDLVLGSPSANKYKTKTERSDDDGHVSLTLSLGMPCSTD